MTDPADVRTFDLKRICGLVPDPRFTHGKIIYSRGDMDGNAQQPHK